MTDDKPDSCPGHHQHAQGATDTNMDVFVPWMKKWNLVQDGTPIATPGSSLLPVKMNNAMAMLKIARDEHEIRGGKVLQWWDGNGAAKVFSRNANALVMERAQGQTVPDAYGVARPGRQCQPYCLRHGGATARPRAAHFGPTSIGSFTIVVR